MPGRAVAALPQLPAPHVYERDRQGQGRRLRDPPGPRRPALAPGLPRPARVERAADAALRARRLAARPRRRGPAEAQRGRSRGVPAQAARRGPQARPADAQGLRAVPAADGPCVRPDTRRERHGQRGPERLVLRDHLLRALPGRRRGVHRGGARRRDAWRVVPAPAARVGELRRQPPDARDVGQPRLPDRAPPLPEPAVEPVPGDRRDGAGGLRQVRPALHDGSVPPAVLAGDPVDLAALPAGAGGSGSGSAAGNDGVCAAGPRAPRRPDHRPHPGNRGPTCRNVGNRPPPVQAPRTVL
ncbi:putative ABC transporter ATP-binding protein [Pseudonocardia sp. Ae263_Ps1]|nr:putative ABC transporter ATP-binding protein [Pseudonocardia sp. Ae263_Ps1]